MARTKTNNFVLPQARAMEWMLREGRGFYIKEDKENYMTYLTPDGVCLYGIPTENFFLDKERYKQISLTTKLEQGSEKVVAEDIREEPNRKIRIFKFSNGETVQINEKYYQDFQKVYGEWFQLGVTAYAQGPNAPVMFVWDDKVIGFILPIRH